MTTTSFAQLSNQALLDEVQRLVECERQATACLIASLMEVDARRLYLGQGCASLFTYCTQVLHLSEHAAYRRIEAARAARRFPAILERLWDGAITLTAIGLLAPHLTADNHVALLDAARHRRKREVEQLVAAIAPRPDVPPSVRKLPPPKPLAAPDDLADDVLRGIGTEPVPPNGTADPPPAAAVLGPVKTAAVVVPLAPERYKVQFTVGRETYEKLRRAQDLLRHSIPSGDPAAVFDRALTLLVAELERTRLASTARPRPGRRTRPGSREIPAAVKRTVWTRDGGRCAFVGGNGRCNETAFLQFHHVVPYARGGPAVVGNIELRCAAHNAYEAEKDFGLRQPALLRERSPTYGSRVRAATALPCEPTPGTEVVPATKLATEDNGPF